MRRGRLAVPVIALALAVAVGPAWGQRAGGERQFNQQLNKVRQQVQPHFRDIRGQFANLRAQGINTSGWERQLNQAEAMLNNLRWQPGMGSGQGTGFQSINPFGDFLFSGVPITPAPGGKLVTRHLDPTGLAQRAEEWARALSDPYQLISRAHEMAGDLRAINEQLNARQGAERQKFLADLGQAMALAHIEQRELKAADLGGGGRELKPKGVGEDTSGLPRLRGDTPMLLRDPFGEHSAKTGGQPDLLASTGRNDVLGRAAGFPLAPVDKLGTLDPADARANLARMTPEQLKDLDLLTQQRVATLNTAIDGMKQKEFGAQLGANSPPDIKTWKDAAAEKIMDLLPFAKQMEALGKGQALEMDVEGKYKLYKEGDKAYKDASSLIERVDGEKYAKTQRMLGVPEGVTVSTEELARMAAARATDPAGYDRLIAKVGWEDARGLAGLGLSALRISAESGMAYKKISEAQNWQDAVINGGPHVADALKEAMPRPGEVVKIGQWVGENVSPSAGAQIAGAAGTAARANFALIAGELLIDIGTRGFDMHITNQALRDAQAANKVLAIDLASRRGDLERRLNDARNLQQLIQERLGGR